MFGWQRARAGRRARAEAAGRAGIWAKRGKRGEEGLGLAALGRTRVAVGLGFVLGLGSFSNPFPFYFFSFLNLNQTKFEFKYKFEFNYTQIIKTMHQHECNIKFLNLDKF